MMTIRISKEALMLFALFIMMTVFGILYMAKSEAIYNEGSSVQQTASYEETNVRTDHTATENGEVLGIVK